MTRTVSSLTWIDTADPKEPIAPYNVDFGADQTWVFDLSGSYHGFEIVAPAVAVDNSLNANPVTVLFGTDLITIQPYRYQPVRFPRGTREFTIAAPTPDQIKIQFFINYAQPAQDSQYLIASATGGTSSVLPIGVIMAYRDGTIPPLWLKADGTDVSRTTYAALFAVYGTTFGAGDGVNTFGLPTWFAFEVGQIGIIFAGA